MPLRKGKIDYAELRQRTKGDRGLLGPSADAPAPSSPQSPEPEPAKRKATPAPPPTLERKTPKPAPKPAPARTAASAAPPQEGKGGYLRITMRPIKRGHCDEYDAILDAMDQKIADKTILARAIAAAETNPSLTVSRKMKLYPSGDGDSFKTRRVIAASVVDRIKEIFDPLDVLSDNALGAIVSDVIVTNYIESRRA